MECNCSKSGVLTPQMDLLRSRQYFQQKKGKSMLVRAFVFILFLIMSTVEAWSAPPPDNKTIPPALETWKPWVLYGEEDRFCPTSYNSGELYRCIWPSRLELDIDRKGGRFSQSWLVFKEGWIPLPGSQEMWPQNVPLTKFSLKHYDSQGNFRVK